jgi:hypothetical protein
MTQVPLKKRVETLEREIRSVKNLLTNGPGSQRKSFRDFVGMFHNDSDFKEAMRLGAAYRDSLRPQSGRKRANRK